MKLDYNSPVVLTFTLLSAVVLILEGVFGGVTASLFTFRSTFDFSAPSIMCACSPTPWGMPTGSTWSVTSPLSF